MFEVVPGTFLTQKRPRRYLIVLRGLISFLILAIAFAASRAFTPYASVKPILDAEQDRLPVELQNADQPKWLAWTRQQDKAIRERLQQGELDSMVNLLLYGTSFTSQPRISMEGDGLTKASKAGILRARVNDLVAGLASPGDNERLLAQALRGTRARVVTKGGMTRVGPAWVPDGRASTIRQDCEASLAALDGIGIDLYLLHAPDARVPWLT